MSANVPIGKTRWRNVVDEMRWWRVVEGVWSHRFMRRRRWVEHHVGRASGRVSR